MIDAQTEKKLITANRAFLHGYREDDPYMEDFESDQDLKRPQPPLTKPAMTPEAQHIALPREFDGLLRQQDLSALLCARRSDRVFTDEVLTLPQLSYLLWATQGVQEICGQNYATLRPVPCGGARHEFETYLLVRKVDGLEPGVYHYLPMTHMVERLRGMDDFSGTVSSLLCGQSWAAKANVVFLWTIVPYRAEWRYGIYAHRPALIDLGHVGQNLYLASAALGLGTCTLAAFSDEECTALLGLDGEEEFVVYAAPVGTVRPQKMRPMFLQEI